MRTSVSAPRWSLLLIAGLVLSIALSSGLPGASGQSAGDDQYADPFDDENAGSPDDRRRPRVQVTLVPRGSCTTRSFRAQVTVRDSSSVSTTFRLNRDRIVMTKSKEFDIGVPARNLRSGRYRLSVFAIDATGRQATTRRTFRRC